MSMYLKSKQIKYVFFIGIGGISMSALASFCLKVGVNVLGSDLQKSSITERLTKEGAKIFYSHKRENLCECDLVVYSSAISDDNPELNEAKKRGIELMTRAEFLSAVLSLHKKSVGIAGCHGKTTTTAMIANSLICAGVNPTVFLGGEDLHFSNFRFGGSEVAVSEACEYKKNLLFLNPSVSLVLNVDNDHMDSYADMEDLTDTFKRFCKGRISVINADDLNSRALFDDSTVTFGIKEKATYTAKNVKFNGRGYTFTACIYTKPVCRIKLYVSGIHNVYNALACLSVCHLLGVSPKTVKYALENFKGVKRRDEFLGEYNGVKICADYAHHPKEIKTVLEVYKNRTDKLAVIFQPHTYSRTKLLMPDFICALKDLQNLVVFKTYPARESYDNSGSAERLAKNLQNIGANCLYAKNEEQLFLNINSLVGKVDTILILGAGDVYEIVKGKIAQKK